MTEPGTALLACPTCGQIQQHPQVPAGHRLTCARCAHRLPHGFNPRANERAAALTLAALAVYLPGVVLPVMAISQLGHHHASGIVPGAIALIADGKTTIGLLVLLCSVVVPLFKLAGLLALSTDVRWLARHHRAWTWRIIEWTGKWSMLDVLLVAILIAALKLGDLVTVEPGPGLLFFAAFVVLSLAASACFDHRSIWNRS
jgi:paraquat-inducible protein A